MNLDNFPEVKRPPRLHAGVGLHRDASLERLPDALRLQVGGDYHQQKHGAAKTRDGGETHESSAKAQSKSYLTLLPHDDGHYDVELKLPAGSGQGFGAGGQHVVGQRGVQDEHELRAAPRHQFQLPDHSGRGEVGCKPEAETEPELTRLHPFGLRMTAN